MPAAKNPPPDRPCSICGETFSPQNTRNVCCGEPCIRERRRRASATWYEANSEAHKVAVVERRPVDLDAHPSISGAARTAHGHLAAPESRFQCLLDRSIALCDVHVGLLPGRLRWRENTHDQRKPSSGNTHDQRESTLTGSGRAGRVCGSK